MSSSTPGILVARTDRLGDTLLSLPAIDVLRRSLPEARLDLLCRREVAAAIRPYLSANGIGWIEFRDSEPAPFHAGQYGAALFLFAPAATLWGAARRRIPLRVGNRSKAASFVLLNAGLRQRRSDGSRNEAEYNVELARALLARYNVDAAPVQPVEIPVDAEAEREARRKLDELQIRDDFWVVHPGMSGSARNLDGAHYVRLIAALEERLGGRWLMTCGPAEGDRKMCSAIRSVRPDAPVVEGLSLPGLRELFRAARLVLAPSTGPLHLAHYVGTTVVGLYSPVRSQMASRWGPRGGTGRVLVLSPDVDCPGRRQCLGERCSRYDCMAHTDWAELILRHQGAWMTER